MRRLQAQLGSAKAPAAGSPASREEGRASRSRRPRVAREAPRRPPLATTTASGVNSPRDAVMGRFRGDKHPGDGAQASCGTRGGAQDDVKALLSTCHYIASLLDMRQRVSGPCARCSLCSGDSEK